MSQARALPRSEGADRQLGMSYEEAKALARDDDPAVRGDLARRDDIRPELLYFLASDDSGDVRRQVAGNARTPAQADLLLARDVDPAVRGDLAAKVARLLPGLGDKDRKDAGHHVLRTLEILVQDQTVRVRRIMAETLKAMTDVPETVVRRLAGDRDDSVAVPVLEFSPLLSDADLLEIIEHGCASGPLAAISRRHGLAATVADAVVTTDDTAAIAALLANESAQIREETLDRLVEKAPSVTAWHEPLVARPRLSSRAVRKLAGFVARGLLERLMAREGLDRETADLVAREMRNRLADAGAPSGLDPDGGLERAQALHTSGRLNEEVISEAVVTGDRDFVRHGLALLSGLGAHKVESILRAGNPQGVTALVWRCGLSMAFGTQLQVRMGSIAPQDALRAAPDGGFPLSEEEMRWQLALFENIIG